MCEKYSIYVEQIRKKPKKPSVLVNFVSFQPKDRFFFRYYEDFNCIPSISVTPMTIYFSSSVHIDGCFFHSEILQISCMCRQHTTYLQMFTVDTISHGEISLLSSLRLQLNLLPTGCINIDTNHIGSWQVLNFVDSTIFPFYSTIYMDIA